MKLRTHQFGGNFEEIEEREINKMAKQPETYCKSMTVSAPLWMIKYIRETPEIKPSKLFQDAILNAKDKLDTKSVRPEDKLFP